MKRTIHNFPSIFGVDTSITPKKIPYHFISTLLNVNCGLEITIVNGVKIDVVKHALPGKMMQGSQPFKQIKNYI